MALFYAPNSWHLWWNDHKEIALETLKNWFMLNSNNIKAVWIFQDTVHNFYNKHGGRWVFFGGK